MSERVLVAPDAFKGTIPAAAVADALARGLRERGVGAQECPVADGGEGTLEALLRARGGELHTAATTDALGRPIEAEWALLSDGATAVVEAARVSGLALIEPAERDAEGASTAGTGTLILAAHAAGARSVIVCVGGTATTDGGSGALAAIEAGGGIGRLAIVVACDVTTPFELAAEVFAAQKGASSDAVARLSRRLELLAGELPRDPRGRPMTGAGGGLAGGLWSRHGAELRSGAELVLEEVGFAARLIEADAVIIGEGRLDAQSLAGKVGGVILARARERGVPVHAVAGAADIERSDPAWAGLASLQRAGSLAELLELGRRWPWVLTG
ncbi:MAG TPA: glycerate kinase [Solirubrobacteraceae bacterium]